MGVTKAIIGLAAVVGGSLTLWRGVGEIADWRSLGPPYWWVLQWHPLGIAADPPPTSQTAKYDHAVRIYRWEKDRWAPVTGFVYDVTRQESMLRGDPHGRNLYGQVWWMDDHKGGWRRTRVYYGGSAEA